MRRLFKNRILSAALLSLLAFTGAQAVHTDSAKAHPVNSVADGDATSTYPSDTGWG
ncbi:hypothetical protein OHT68_30215 [Streptomyces canus]|uniref:hypothetical protein n=1 Tax=Streptomyces canus TaxID=58343 RepID=UPI002E2A8611|nr:hypothetical protein [Streptomyces canus]